MKKKCEHLWVATTTHPVFKCSSCSRLGWQRPKTGVVREYQAPQPEEHYQAPSWRAPRLFEERDEEW